MFKMEIRRAVTVAMLLAISATAAAQPRPDARLLDAHNVERHAIGALPLVWNGQLAQAADGYAAQLARSGRFAHSPADLRNGEGENLWMGTRGGFTLEEMIADWASEKRIFRAGKFPNVSRTASWADVGHFTQIIWPTTTQVGCSVRSSLHWDYLVCRYSMPGNVMGQHVGSTRIAAR